MPQPVTRRASARLARIRCKLFRVCRRGCRVSGSLPVPMTISSLPEPCREGIGTRRRAPSLSGHRAAGCVPGWTPRMGALGGEGVRDMEGWGTGCGRLSPQSWKAGSRGAPRGFFRCYRAGGLVPYLGRQASGTCTPRFRQAAVEPRGAGRLRNILQTRLAGRRASPKRRESLIPLWGPSRPAGRIAPPLRLRSTPRHITRPAAPASFVYRVMARLKPCALRGASMDRCVPKGMP